MNSSQPPSPPEGPAAPLPPAALWRKLLWLFLVVTGVVPAVLAATFALLRLGSRLPVVGESINGSPLAVGAGLLVATVAVVLGVRTGLRRDWPARTHQLLLLGALTAVVGGTVAWGLRDVQRASSASAVQSRLAGIRAAAQQYFLETGTFFVTQDELVGPDRYLRSLNPVVGEDYRPLFPLRLDHVERLRVTLPDGRVIALEYEDPPPDGVQVVELNSWRLETTYRSGWPDGPARVRDQAGRLLSEAEYVAGHLVGPCWVFRDGARIDLNSPANRPPDVLAREQLAAGDFAGAEPQFTRALALTDTAELREGRGDARRGLGRGDDAITDYEVALRLDPGSPRRAGIRDKLEPLFRERSARLRARGDAAGAAAAEAAAERVQLPRLDEQAGARMRAQDHAGAAALSSRAIELEPSPGRHLRRAQARYELGDLDGSLADLDAVIRLSSGPPQLHHLNRAYLRRLKDDRPGAAADLRAVVRHGVGNVNFRGEACHAACWLFLFESEDGRGEAAAAELAQTVAAVDRLGPSEQVWFRAAADLLLGRLQEEQLMARVAALTGPSGETIRFQALFYAAMLRRRAGDTPGAIGLFHRALQNPYARQFQPEWQECRRAVAAPGEQSR